MQCMQTNEFFYLFRLFFFFFQVELGIGDIVLGVVCLAWADGLEVLRRNSSPNLASRNFRVLKHEGTCCYDASFAHLAAVE